MDWVKIKNASEGLSVTKKGMNVKEIKIIVKQFYPKLSVSSLIRDKLEILLKEILHEHESDIPVNSEILEEKMTQTITITFGDVAENNPGMQKIGKLADSGFTYQDLLDTENNFIKFSEQCPELKIATEIINLNTYNNMEGDPAYLLIIRNGINMLLYNDNVNADNLYTEQNNLIPDKKATFRGKVLNKLARHNLCYDEKSQVADYEAGKGTVIAYNTVPLLNIIKTQLPVFFTEKSQNLRAEANYYYNPDKCGIGFHGDGERKKVIALRLGVSIPLHYQ